MMDETLDSAREHFIQGMSRISHFWGFSRAMGAIYGVIYLSPQPLSLDEIADQAGVSKGTVSTNVRHLERLGMVHKHIEVGSRRDFYSAETDFWGIIKGILEQREKSEFDHALRTVGESLALVAEAQEDERADFYRQRMRAMQDFFQTLDSLVATALKLEGLVSLSALQGVLKRSFSDE